MKTPITILFVLSGLLSHAQTINWDTVRQAYFDKYRPTDTAAWLLPIIFEEGGGTEIRYILVTTLNLSLEKIVFLERN